MQKESVLGLTMFDKIFIFILLILIGGAVGWFLPVIANWLLQLPVVPWEEIVKFVASLNSFWVSMIAAVVGIIIGILLTFSIFEESLEVKVTDDHVQLKLGEHVERLEKKDISAIFMDDKQLVILDQNTNEIYREVLDVKKKNIEETFIEFNYPWYDQDPYENEYERWVMGYPDFPEKINALLHAREIALRDDKKEDAKYLRKDLIKLGVVIRGENNAQYVRLVKLESDSK